jgi:hypothetical protein
MLRRSIDPGQFATNAKLAERDHVVVRGATPERPKLLLEQVRSGKSAEEVGSCEKDALSFPIGNGDQCIVGIEGDWSAQQDTHSNPPMSGVVHAYCPQPCGRRRIPPESQTPTIARFSYPKRMNFAVIVGQLADLYGVSSAGEAA